MVRHVIRFNVIFFVIHLLRFPNPLQGLEITGSNCSDEGRLSESGFSQILMVTNGDQCTPLVYFWRRVMGFGSPPYCRFPSLVLSRSGAIVNRTNNGQRCQYKGFGYYTDPFGRFNINQHLSISDRTGKLGIIIHDISNQFESNYENAIRQNKIVPII